MSRRGVGDRSQAPAAAPPPRIDPAVWEPWTTRLTYHPPRLEPDMGFPMTTPMWIRLTEIALAGMSGSEERCGTW
jgi:hypothetical protein